MLDKLAGGYGVSVGRRAEEDLRVGDILDVWKVIDLREGKRLLLKAQMKVAGEAWLEFRIEGNTLVQTAYHYPKGLTGQALLVLHGPVPRLHLPGHGPQHRPAGGGDGVTLSLSLPICYPVPP